MLTSTMRFSPSFPQSYSTESMPTYIQEVERKSSPYNLCGTKLHYLLQNSRILVGEQTSEPPEYLTSYAKALRNIYLVVAGSWGPKQPLWLLCPKAAHVVIILFSSFL